MQLTIDQIRSGWGEEVAAAESKFRKRIAANVANKVKYFVTFNHAEETHSLEEKAKEHAYLPVCLKYKCA